MLWAEPDERVIGVPFLVMSFVEGFVPLGKPSLHVAGPVTQLSPQVRARMGAAAMRSLAAIHALDWPRTHPFFQRPRGNGLAEHLDRLAVWYRSATEARPYPITDAALDYLMVRRADVDAGPPCLIWNDARAGNILFRPDGEVAAIIDWEAAAIAPAPIDLGYWLLMEEFHGVAIGVSPLPGWADRATLLQAYESAGGHVATDLDYFIILGALFMATTMIRQAHIEIADKRLEPDTTLGHANTATRILAARLGLPVPDPSPDFISRRGLSRQGRVLTAKDLSVS
jgi:aminoglycoside phosphotransferase (APT) family kinase protein